MKSIKITALILCVFSLAAGIGYGAYQGKVHFEQGGRSMVVANGGKVTFQTGSTLTMSPATVDSIRTASVKTSGYLIANGASILRGGATVTGAISATTTVTGAGILNTGKYYGLTACAGWSDTTGWTGPRMFIFAAADTIYFYTAAHTIKKIPAI